jgi:curved DNA-binding protein
MVKILRGSPTKYHPDVSKKRAESAQGSDHEVLKDREARRNQWAASGSRAGFGRRRMGQRYEYRWRRSAAVRGGAYRAAAAVLRAEDFSDFFSSLFGGAPFAGGGARAARDHHARVDITLEEAFRGDARSSCGPQVKPDGTVTLETHTVRVTIPAGITEGQLVRLGGQGAPGAGGGAAGDLYLEVHILPHALYQLDGRDVTLTFPVAPWEAALGAAVNVPTLGGAVAMQVPANSQSGQKLRLRGRGLPRTPPGDQYVQLKVVVPSASSPEARALYEQMRDKLNFDPRADFAR